MDGAGNQII